MQIKEIKERLASRMLEVCQHLYPNGRLDGANWCVGGPAGEAGGSMAIQTRGIKAGVWADFAGDARGDVMDLWMAARSCDFFTAKNEAELFLGGQPVPITMVPKNYSNPGKLKNSKELNVCKEAEDYIKGIRLITEDIIGRFRIRFLPETEEFVFPFIDRTGEVRNRKYLGLRRVDGKKKIRAEKDGFPILFGWHGIKPDRQIIICEGEIDCLTWNQIGFPCLSVPSGVENLDWIGLEWENLECFEEIFLSFDMDQAGQKNVPDIARRLGLGKCRIVKLGYKDANECLQRGWTPNDFISAVQQSKLIEVSKIINVEEAGRISDEVEANPPKFFRSELLGPVVPFAGSELTLWAGYTNHGKTSMLNNFVVESAMHGYHTLIISLEQQPDEILRSMERILALACAPTREQKIEARKKLIGKVFFLNQMGRVTPKDILFYMEYASARYGIRNIIVDSLMMIDLPADDFNGQKKFAEDIRTHAVRFKCDIHLVIHTTKEFDERNMKVVPSLNILRGSADVGHACDNAFFVRRNPNKFDDDPEHSDEADTLLICLKNRRGGYRGTITLSYDKASGQFHRGVPFKAANYLQWVGV